MRDIAHKLIHCIERQQCLADVAEKRNGVFDECVDGLHRRKAVVSRCDEYSRNAVAVDETDVGRYQCAIVLHGQVMDQSRYNPSVMVARIDVDVYRTSWLVVL